MGQPSVIFHCCGSAGTQQIPIAYSFILPLKEQSPKSELKAHVFSLAPLFSK